MPRSADFDWGSAFVAALILVLFWPWVVLLIDLVHWVLTGARLFPGIVGARLGVAILWPPMCGLIVIVLAR